MTVYLQNPNGVKESFYIERLRNCIEHSGDPYDHEIGHKSFTHWIGYTDMHKPQQIWIDRYEYHEEEYKGFQIVVIAKHYKHQDLFDKSGNLITGRSWDQDDIGSFGVENDYIDYLALAYEIGSPEDQVVNLSNRFQFSILNGIGVANSLEKTFKKARKSLEIRALIKPLRPELISMSHQHLFRTKATVPYNASIGDHVFVQAFGRLRKGIIVATTGSRFIVAYLTPSNSRDLKWKSLPLSQLFIEP